MDLYFVEQINALCSICPASWESGDRTPRHNQSVGGAPSSWHVKGLAIDLIYDSQDELLTATRLAIERGFLGIEMDITNCHLHLDGRKIQWWVVKDSVGYHSLMDYLTQLDVSASI